MKTLQSEKMDEMPRDPLKKLSPAAERALNEAKERRARYAEQEAKSAREIGGRKGPDPARYGDWEVKGIATDF